MRVAGVEREAEDALQFLHAGKRFPTERGFALEGVQDHALEEITQGHVVIVGQRLEDLEHSFFEPNASLDPIDQDPIALRGLL